MQREQRERLYEELNQLDELELTAMGMDEYELKQLIKNITTSGWNQLQENTIMASFVMKPHQKITFLKHPRFVRIWDHKHDFLELTYAYKGGFTQVINGKRLEMQEGDITILDTHIAHRIEPVSQDSLVINILMKEEYFNEQLIMRLSDHNLISEFIISAIYKTSLKGRYLYFSPGENEKIKTNVESILWEIKYPQLGSQEFINCHLILLFTELMRSVGDETTLDDAVKKRSGKTAVSVFALIQFINEHFMQLSLEQTANHFHIHPKYVTRLLKKYTGKGFMAIIQELRLEKAVFLLEHTQLSIYEIAEKCGFSNMNHFYAHFKKRYHQTPKEYRKG